MCWVEDMRQLSHTKLWIERCAVIRLCTLAREFAKSFYASKAWRECRASYIASVYNMCESCKKKGIVKPGKILHHLNYLTPENINDPNVSLNHALLRYDCQECHNREHHGDDREAVREGLCFDMDGQLVVNNKLN